MTPPRPEIFISAATSDLGTCRQLIKEALLTLGYTPVEQTNFPPGAKQVQAKLREKIAACHAVIHVAGVAYGAEPVERQSNEPDAPRRSFTQMEYDIARELGKPVYVFVCGEHFPYDAHEPEDDERRALQQAHRDRLLGTDHEYTLVTSREELEKRVRELQLKIEQLTKQLRRFGNRLIYGLIAAVMIIGGGLLWLSQQGSGIEQKTGQIIEQNRQTDDRLRELLSMVANNNMALQSQLAELQLTDAEIFQRAITSTAEQAGIPEAELESAMRLFIAAVRADPEADFMDRALADFGELNFAAAARHAGQAAEQAHERRIAAEQLVTRAAEKAHTARTQERKARNLQGQSFYAEKQYTQALEAFERALAVTPRSEYPEDWANLQHRRGVALDELASVSTDADIGAYREKAIAAYRAALEVFTPEALPQDWAETYYNLADALLEQAALDGNDRLLFLNEALAAKEAALEIITPDFYPEYHAQGIAWINAVEAEIEQLTKH